MRNKHTKILLQGIFLISIFNILLIFIFHSAKNLNFYFLIFLFLIIIFISFTITSYLLFSSFKTNQTLDELLKETLHEINIPISVIKANAQMLQESIKDEISLKRVGRIEKSSQILYSLYNEFEYLIKKEIKTIENEEFDAKDVILQTIEQTKGLKKGVFVKHNLQITIINADKMGFSRVISNLLTNSYKFNAKNINLNLSNETFSIKDDGDGIAEDMLVKVFDRYYQENQTKKGFGMGLSIVKSYCDNFAIGINIKSKPKNGTTIELDLKKLVKLKHY